MPFQYSDIEDAIVARLTTPMADVAVVTILPENEKAVRDAVDAAINSDKTLVFVAYTGSDFDGGNSMNYISQDETVNMLHNLQGNRLRGDTGIYNVIRILKQKLQGYEVPNGSRLKLKSIDFDDRDQKMAMFSYNVVFTFTKLQVQSDVDGDDDTTGSATFSQYNFQTDYHAQ